MVVVVVVVDVSILDRPPSDRLSNLAGFWFLVSGFGGILKEILCFGAPTSLSLPSRNLPAKVVGGGALQDPKISLSHKK